MCEVKKGAQFRRGHKVSRRIVVPGKSRASSQQLVATLCTTRREAAGMDLVVNFDRHGRTGARAEFDARPEAAEQSSQPN